MAVGVRIPEEQVEFILKARRDGQHPRDIAREVAVSEKTVYNIIRRYVSTTESAQAFLKASALKLAHKIVRHSTVSEAMDVLSRPNVGVLHPSRATDGHSQILISIGQDSLGAIQSGQQSHLGLPAPVPRVIMGHHEAEPAPQALASTGNPHLEAQSGVSGPSTGSSNPSPGDQTPPKGPVNRSGNTKRSPKPRREALRAVPAPYDISGIPPSREAIKGRGGNTGINLRYDIVEPD